MTTGLLHGAQRRILTQSNHPENVGAEAPPPRVSLGAAVGIAAFSSLVGMTFGSAALSTAFLAETRAELYSVLPMIATAVCFLGGWMGAFFYMCREEASKHEGEA